MRRSQKLESLGAGYRRAHFLASWAGIYFGTHRRHTPAATRRDDHHRGRSTWHAILLILWISLDCSLKTGREEGYLHQALAYQALVAVYFSTEARRLII
jgi:hypothetical protein